MTTNLFSGIMNHNDNHSMDEDQEKLDQCIEHCESFYCDRLTELVDEKKIDDASAIFEEFVVEGEEPDDWFFIKFLDKNLIEEFWD